MIELKIRVSVGNTDERDELVEFLDDNNYIYEIDEEDE